MGLKLTNPLAVLDIEATGINVMHDRIVEIAVVKAMPNGDRIAFERRVNPEKEISVEAQLLHGISNEDVKDKPTFKQIAKELAAFLKGADLAGFNLLRFDIPILVESFLRSEVEFKFDSRSIVDVQRLFHLMEKRTLKAAYMFYCNEELVQAHSAMADTEATLKVLVAQIQRYENQPVVDAMGKVLGFVKNDVKSLHELTHTNAIDLAGRLVYNEQRVPVFNFGKHKGKSIEGVLEAEPSYYHWFLQGDFPLDTKRKLTQIKMGLPF